MPKRKDNPRIFAIVPAAGRSRRMGAPKQLLEVDGRPMLRAVLEPLMAAETAGVVVVTHSEIAKQVELGDLGYVALAINDDEQSEMIESVRQGMRVWRLRAKIDDKDGFLVCPGDQPGITADDHNTCIAAFRDGSVPHPDARGGAAALRDGAPADAIVLATRAGRRGHPIIFPAALAEVVDSQICDLGLNALPREHADRVREVACKSTGVTRDVDTPAAYQRIAR